MCMTMAFSWGAGCIVATDTRNTMKYHDGRIARRDTGGKLMRIGGAWVTATGCGFYLDVALSALAGIDCADRDAVTKALRGAQRRRPSSTANTRVLVATDTHFGFFDASGELLSWQTRGVRAVWPDLEPAEIEARGPRLPVELGACRSVHDAIRVFGQHFAEVADLHDSVGPVVQIAGKDHSPWFLEADAWALSRMNDAEIAALRRPAPVADLRAFTRIAREVEPGSIAADGSIASPGYDVDPSGNASFDGTVKVGGSIESPNFLTGVDGWQVNAAGDAEFNDVTIRGTLIGDVSGTVSVGSALASPNYVAGTTGWEIGADGSAEFNNVTIRGTLDGVTGSFLNGVVFSDVGSTEEANISYNGVYLTVESDDAGGVVTPPSISLGSDLVDSALVTRIYIDADEVYINGVLQ